MESPLGPFLISPGYAGPAWWALGRESSVVGEALKMAQRTGCDRSLRRRRVAADRERDACPAVLVPGLMAGDATLVPMGRFLRRHGVRSYRSRIHLNAGCTRAAADRLEARLESAAEREDRRVAIVGHSLGGLLARAVAARRPDLVSGIVTLGSPVLAPGAIHRVLAWDIELLTRLNGVGLAGLMAADCVAGECAREAYRESRRPLPADVDYVAVYTRRDGIVDWRACADPAATQVEVASSHCGLAVDPVVSDVVLRSLQRMAAGTPSVAA